MKHRKHLLLIGASLVVLAATPSSAEESALDFVRDVRPILQKHCYECHADQKQKSGLRLDIKSEAFKGGELYGPSILAGRPDESPLIQFVADPDADLQMPPEGERLSQTEIGILTRWVEEGAPWPDGVDLAKVVDRRDHWSFKPVRGIEIPRPKTTGWIRNEVDAFVLSRLEQHGLQPSAPADRKDLLRRVYFDLIGLPPTPEQIAAFVDDPRDDAYERVVEQLLGSTRYGERWAQHWLDVVRYADTHGYEVNTPRPNAWPYRDYVIESFNNDTPYDQFIREQLVGDALGKDAATGFLVTAAALLPGQIGADEASKRLARQDALDEILINTGEAFLGLSIGCARCHDHKFDPISQRDYYTMQAFFSGVRFGERPDRSPEAEAERREVEQMRERLSEIEGRLAEFEPPARLSLRVTDAKYNEAKFEPREARFVRFWIDDANLHPSLGLIEPCLDEFEIYGEADSGTASNAAGENLALAASGTKVTASGSRESEAHQLQHVNDGLYGNSKSWMSDEAGRGWVMFELPHPTRISRIVWSRDRTGHYTDRLATAYRLEVGLSLDAMQTVDAVSPPRPSVNARKNVDRFGAERAAGLRFTIQATNSLAPCLDELEVFDIEGNNVALAEAGATVVSSGDAPETEQHKLKHLNDGQYGNARSWISSEDGQGWVEVTFASPVEVDRVVWGRDREDKFKDRLAIDYSVELVLESGERKVVATSVDRTPFSESASAKPASVSLAGLAPNERDIARRLLDEQKTLQAKIEAGTSSLMVYAGNFTEPEPTHLLLRGDPEQPGERLPPRVLEALGTVQLSQDATERERREALAKWIADPRHPLTARVMVNRIWQGHFGTGLVASASDFGWNGQAPSHPDLLDWLAAEFIRSGWSVKHMHRLIVLSATYRQSSRVDPEAAARDADVRLLWRYPARRLEAEAIRDSMLAVSGRLNLETGGPGFDLFKSRGGLSGFPPVESFGPEGRRRLIYAHKIRMERDIVFGAFDCPDAGQSTARRRQSTTPIQALNLFNSVFTLDESAAFADRVKREVGPDVPSQIRRVYQLAFGREPDQQELEETEPVVHRHGLSTLCRVVFNSNEFLFIP